MPAQRGPIQLPCLIPKSQTQAFQSHRAKMSRQDLATLQRAQGSARVSISLFRSKLVPGALESSSVILPGTCVMLPVSESVRRENLHKFCGNTQSHRQVCVLTVNPFVR